jgi:hypothetical protein
MGRSAVGRSVRRDRHYLQSGLGGEKVVSDALSGIPFLS